jgi:hypothetical protein
MFKNPLAISVALFGCLVALAFAKGKTTSPESSLAKNKIQAARAPANLAAKPGSLRSAD